MRIIEILEQVELTAKDFQKGVDDVAPEAIQELQKCIAMLVDLLHEAGDGEMVHAINAHMAARDAAKKLIEINTLLNEMIDELSKCRTERLKRLA